MSSVDWPGKLVATVFAQGCPWACGYCHNHAIIDCQTPGILPWEEVVALMKRRHGLLDGIVFRRRGSQPALLDAARGVKTWVSSWPAYRRSISEALQHLLDAGLIDWVGMDIKATPNNYPAVVGRPNSGRSVGIAADPVRLRAAASDDYEIRLTAFQVRQVMNLRSLAVVVTP